MAFTTTTLAQLEARLADRFESTIFWTAEESRLAINEALRVWNLLIGFWKARVILPTVAGQTWYPTPAPLLYPVRMDFGNAPLVLTSLFDLDLGHPSWEGETTATPGNPASPMVWVPLGLTQFAIWPADAIGQNSLVLDGVTVAPQLVMLTDYLDLGEEEVGLLLGFALHVLTWKVGGDRFAATLPFYQAFLKAAMARNARLASFKAFETLEDASGKEDAVPGPPKIVPAS
jgi:hypothetical protein